MPITATNPLRGEAPIEDVRDRIATSRGTARGKIDDALTKAVADENASDERAPDLTVEAVAGLLATAGDPNVLGLANHIREIAAPLDLAGWRRAWPTVLGPLDDRSASALIRFAEELAKDDAAAVEAVVIAEVPRGVTVERAQPGGTPVGRAEG